MEIALDNISQMSIKYGIVSKISIYNQKNTWLRHKTVTFKIHNGTVRTFNLTI